MGVRMRLQRSRRVALAVSACASAAPSFQKPERSARSSCATARRTIGRWEPTAVPAATAGACGAGRDRSGAGRSSCLRCSAPRPNRAGRWTASARARGPASRGAVEQRDDRPSTRGELREGVHARFSHASVQALGALRQHPGDVGPRAQAARAPIDPRRAVPIVAGKPRPNSRGGMELNAITPPLASASSGWPR